MELFFCLLIVVRGEWNLLGWFWLILKFLLGWRGIIMILFYKELMGSGCLVVLIYGWLLFGEVWEK